MKERCVDKETVEMQKICMTVMLAALIFPGSALSAAERSSPIQAQETAADTTSCPGGYGTFSLGPVQVPSSGVTDVQAAMSQSGDVWQVDMTLTPEKAAALRDFTSRSIGSNVDICIDGVIMNAPRIAEEIAGPYLSLFLPEDEARRLADILAGTGAHGARD